MLDEQTRATILKLYDLGHGKRAIARALKISRAAVRKVIARGSPVVPMLSRQEKGEAHHDEILELFAECKGNLVRVHEELEAQGAELSYQALTGYCRRHGIGQAPKEPAGQYDFAPGQEMQLDTSPHPAHIGGREQGVQIAGLALAYSRLFFIQLYPRFTRFECKVFLDDALDYVGGVCSKCMIDNTSVIVLRGTGALMVPVDEMATFAECRGFEFRAHEKGDANRSAVIEGLFNFVQKNFLAGHNAGPIVLGRMGPEALDSIVEFINDSEVDPVRRGAIGGGALVYIGLHHPEHRPRIAAFLVELLEREDEDPELTTFLAVEVACVDTPEVQAALEAAVDRGAVDDFIIDFDELRERMSGDGEPWHGRPSDYDLMAELQDMKVLSFSDKAIQGLVDQDVERYGMQDQPLPVSPPPSPLVPTPGRSKKRSAKEKAKRKQARKARNRKRR